MVFLFICDARFLCLMSMSATTPRSLYIVKNCAHLILYSGQEVPRPTALEAYFTRSSLLLQFDLLGTLPKPPARWPLDGYPFQSTKTKLNVKLLKVVDGYHNADCDVAVIQS